MLKPLFPKKVSPGKSNASERNALRLLAERTGWEIKYAGFPMAIYRMVLECDTEDSRWKTCPKSEVMGAIRYGYPELLGTFKSVGRIVPDGWTRTQNDDGIDILLAIEIEESNYIPDEKMGTYADLWFEMDTVDSRCCLGLYRADKYGLGYSVSLMDQWYARGMPGIRGPNHDNGRSIGISGRSEC